MAAQSSVDSCAAMPGGGRCGVRTRDPFGVNEVRYHCANRPRWRNYARSGGACPGRRATIRRHQCRGSRRSSNHLMTSDTPVSGDRGSDTSSCNARWQRTRSATRSPPFPSTAFPRSHAPPSPIPPHRDLDQHPSGPDVEHVQPIPNRDTPMDHINETPFWLGESQVFGASIPPRFASLLKHPLKFFFVARQEPQGAKAPQRTAGKHADVAQLVEHHLAKVRVAGSSPVVRSERSFGPIHMVEWPRGEATDCKSVYTGSNPVSTSGGWRSGSALP